MPNYDIMRSQAQNDQEAEQEGECVGIARFTAQEWSRGGQVVVAHHSVELRVRFDPATKKWEVVGQKEWEGVI